MHAYQQLPEVPTEETQEKSKLNIYLRPGKGQGVTARMVFA
jgi:hypothetical protein